jgi:sn1-specific diacylglycerol lipase
MQFLLFQRRLKVAADDMTPKYFVILIFRWIWIAFSVSSNLICFSWITTLLIVLFTINSCMEALILYVTLQGTIANPEPRQVLQYLVPIEIGLRSVEILMLGTGLYEGYRPTNTCPVQAKRYLQTSCVGALLHCLVFFAILVVLYLHSTPVQEDVQKYKEKRQQIWEDVISTWIPKIKHDARKLSILRESTKTMMEWFPSRWAPSDFAISLWLWTKEQLILRHLEELDRYPTQKHHLDSGLAFVHFVNMRKVSKPLLHKLAFRMEGTLSITMSDRPRIPTPDLLSERVSIVTHDNLSNISIVDTCHEMAQQDSQSTLYQTASECHSDTRIQVPEILINTPSEPSVPNDHADRELQELLELQGVSTQQGSDDVLPDVTQDKVTKESIADIIHFSKYAKLAYKTTSSPQLEQFQLLHNSDDNDIFYSPYLILLDHDWKSIVISIRGSSSLEDALVDLKFTDVELDGDLGPEYRVHSGFLTTTMNIMPSIIPLLHQVQQTHEYRDFRIVCTGHSLGAAIASILCYFLRKQNWNAICFGYAMPVVGSDKLAQLFEPFCISIVCGHDIVSRLSYTSWYYFTKDVERILKDADVPKYKVVPSMLMNALLHQQYSSRGWYWADRHAAVSDEGPPFQKVTLPERLVHTCSAVPGRILYLEKLRDFAHRFADTLVKTRIEQLKEGLQYLLRRVLLQKGSKRAIRFVYVPRWAEKSEFKELVFSRTTLSDHADCCEFVQDFADLSEDTQLHTVKYR